MKGIPFSLVVTIPVEDVNKNGMVFTRNAVEQAITAMGNKVPIHIQYDDAERIVGYTDCRPYAMQPDKKHGNGVMFTVDGILSELGMEISIKEREGDTITDFEILSFGL